MVDGAFLVGRPMRLLAFLAVGIAITAIVPSPVAASSWSETRTYVATSIHPIVVGPVEHSFSGGLVCSGTTVDPNGAISGLPVVPVEPGGGVGCMRFTLDAVDPLGSASVTLTFHDAAGRTPTYWAYIYGHDGALWGATTYVGPHTWRIWPEYAYMDVLIDAGSATTGTATMTHSYV